MQARTLQRHHDSSRPSGDSCPLSTVLWFRLRGAELSTTGMSGSESWKGILVDTGWELLM